MRQQKEAQRAALAEEEKLRNERSKQLGAARPMDPEKASLATRESTASAQTLLPPEDRAAPSPFGNSFQSLKRKLTGKTGPQYDKLPIEDDKSGVAAGPSVPTPPIVPHASKPLPPQPPPPSNEYSLNNDYLSSAQSQGSQPHLLDEPIPSDSDEMPGGFTPKARTPRPTDSGATPLSNICTSVPSDQPILRIDLICSEKH